MVIGWMNSANPMTISSDTGVAYDPSCVQHQVRVTQNLTKGLVFGVLDVKAAEKMVWLEMPSMAKDLTYHQPRSGGGYAQAPRQQTERGSLARGGEGLGYVYHGYG